jgi:hypothetical protein
MKTELRSKTHSKKIFLEIFEKPHMKLHTASLGKMEISFESDARKIFRNKYQCAVADDCTGNRDLLEGCDKAK